MINVPLKKEELVSFETDYLFHNDITILVNDHKDADRISNEKLFKTFPQYVFKKEIEEIDYWKTFEAKGLNYDDYLDYDHDYDKDTGDVFFIYKHIKKNITINVSYKEFVIKNVEKEVLAYKTIQETKGQYKDEFWDWSKLDEFDENWDRDPDAVVFLTTNEELEEAKKYFDEDAVFQTYMLSGDEFVQFSW